MNINCLLKKGHIFSNCNSLKYIPDLSIMKINNVNNIINMSNMLSNCNSLLSLPDISRRNTDNVIYMSYMFSSPYAIIITPNEIIIKPIILFITLISLIIISIPKKEQILSNNYHTKIKK